MEGLDLHLDGELERTRGQLKEREQEIRRLKVARTPLQRLQQLHRLHHAPSHSSSSITLLRQLHRTPPTRLALLPRAATSGAPEGALIQTARHGTGRAGGAAGPWRTD